MRLSFTKMQGCANDYIYLDCRASGVPADIAALARQLSARRVSVGADGIICICAAAGADAAMRMFNADGSEGKMCGNGIRCVAEWLYTHDSACAKDSLRIDTASGQKLLRRAGEGRWQVEMGRYSPMAADLPAVHRRVWTVSCISVGNPHCVVPAEDVDGLDLAAIGPAFEGHENFPERVNTEFVQQLGPACLKMRVCERGRGETWACGTGACAAVSAFTELGRVPAGADVRVLLRGGELTIRVLPGRELLMTGDAVTVYEGTAQVNGTESRGSV